MRNGSALPSTEYFLCLLQFALTMAPIVKLKLRALYLGINICVH